MSQLYRDSDYNRRVLVAEASFRTPFRRDNGRLIHSSVFRRLQGKTQLFPGVESDFFRNRLTHSLEVAQIAKGIAEKFNFENDYFKQRPLNIDLVETISLAHDLGHPPFGHNGEKALDMCMIKEGGFEGNAQTLRILSKIEKKSTLENFGDPISPAGADFRNGLNFTYRTLAGILKYDSMIPKEREPNSKVHKGYYFTEADVVNEIKLNVAGDSYSGLFKTIECQIMDVADDIAYSTYDLEDAFKAEFLSPISILASDSNLLSRVARKTSDKLDDLSVNDKTITEVLHEIYKEIYTADMKSFLEKHQLKDIRDMAAIAGSHAFDMSRRLCCDGYVRTKHTSELVNRFMAAVDVEVNDEFPSFSKIIIDPDIKLQIEVLKHYSYEAMIMSPRLKMVEYRGLDIVKEIFNAITEDDTRGVTLLPQDFQDLYKGFNSDKNLQKRTVCDFIAGMTDRYAIEFYSRLKSESPQTIFKPF